MLHQALVQVELLEAREEGNREHAYDDFQPTYGCQTSKYRRSSQCSLAWFGALLQP